MSFWINDLPALMADFGTEATVDGQTVTAIFDADYVGVGDLAVESSGPALTCRSSDVEGVAHGDSVTVDDVTYTVRGIQPDGTGVTVLRLEKA